MTGEREGGTRSLDVGTSTVDWSDLSLAELRGYRGRLTQEEERVSYWRRLVHARLDMLAAEADHERPLHLDELVRVLGDTGSGRSRSALLRVAAADPLPELPALEEMWMSEVDPADHDAVAEATQRLHDAETKLTDYRRALHRRLDEATAELIVRYRRDPASALVALEDPHIRPIGGPA
ncbi:MAG TPA: hypothetical protein VFJ19_14965 [Nocardioidaceae bacterium]|nr:hypothetical protein [Nocardioidaceae bacterium]